MNRYGAFLSTDPLPFMPNGQRNVIRPAAFRKQMVYSAPAPVRTFNTNVPKQSFASEIIEWYPK